MAIVNPKGEWMNSNGTFVHPSRIKKIFKDRDAVVMKIVKRMKKLNTQMLKIKIQNFADIDNYLEKLKKTTGIEKGVKGNLMLSSYDNLCHVELSRNKIEKYDERLNAAKELVDACIIDWSKTAHKYLISAVSVAFQLDKNKNFNTDAIWDLRTLNIPDPRWIKAMQLVADARYIADAKDYMSAAERKSHRQNFKNISLNFSSLEVPEDFINQTSQNYDTRKKD